VHFLLGEIALRQNDPERAIGCFENAVASAPRVSLYYHRLGDAYGRAAQKASIFSAFGFARKCLRAYQRAVELAPDNIDARFSLFMFYRGAPAIIGGGAQKAAAEAAEIERRDPDRGRIAFAALHVAQKQYGDARDAIARIRPVDLSAATGDHVFLSDVQWTSAAVGWGEPVRNHLWLDERSGHDIVLIVHGRSYGKGLFAPAPSRHVYALDGKWKTLATTIGLRDGAAEPASAVFIVRGDGRELFRSATLRVDVSQRVKVDVSHVKELELVTQPGEQHQPSAWAVWAEPVLGR
jgi:tetratricopeptide (TPR) repeat protein